jgi:hypothetical protein
MTTAIILVIMGGWVLITAFVLVVACMFSSRLTQLESNGNAEARYHQEQHSSSRYPRYSVSAWGAERTETAVYQASLSDN